MTEYPLEVREEAARRYNKNYGNTLWASRDFTEEATAGRSRIERRIICQLILETQPKPKEQPDMLLDAAKAVWPTGGLASSIAKQLRAELAKRGVTLTMPEPVDPNLAIAREACALTVDHPDAPKAAAAYRNHEADDSVLVRACLLALKMKDEGQ